MDSSSIEVFACRVRLDNVERELAQQRQFWTSVQLELCRDISAEERALGKTLLGDIEKALRPLEKLVAARNNELHEAEARAVENRAADKLRRVLALADAVAKEAEQTRAAGKAVDDGLLMTLVYGGEDEVGEVLARF